MGARPINDKLRKAVVADIRRLEKKHGAEVVRRCWNAYAKQLRERRKLEREIAARKDRLTQLAR